MDASISGTTNWCFSLPPSHALPLSKNKQDRIKSKGEKKRGWSQAESYLPFNKQTIYKRLMFSPESHWCSEISSLSKAIKRLMFSFTELILLYILLTVIISLLDTVVTHVIKLRRTVCFLLNSAEYAD